VVAVCAALLARDLLAVSDQLRTAAARDHGPFDRAERARLRRHRGCFAERLKRRCMTADTIG
jgi:hypothetical protein